jgi:hypothetical protein
MHPDLFTMAARARLEQRLREAAQARLAAQVRTGHRNRRQHQRLQAAST